jgi:hypothetical protein
MLYLSLLSHFRYRLMLHLAVTLHVFWSTMYVRMCDVFIYTCMYVRVMYVLYMYICTYEGC